MKKIFIIALFLLATNVHADVIPAGEKSVDKCFKITNLDNLNKRYPAVKVKAVITGPMIKGSEEKLVKNNECIDGGYKFNTVDLVAEEEYGKYTLLKDIDFSETTVKENDPTKSITYEYEIFYYSPGGNYLLDKVKKTITYSDGRADKVKYYVNDYSEGDESEVWGDTGQLCNNNSNFIKLKKGDKGGFVGALQGLLGIKPDFKFGPKTAVAVKSFQTKNNMKADGVAGKMTIQALCKE